MMNTPFQKYIFFYYKTSVFLLLQLGKLLDDADYQKQIVPCVVKLFASNDRTTRSRLLQQLDQFIMHLQNATVSSPYFLFSFTTHSI